ncbi:MAG: AraC family transcriptional regulator [Moraxellaceae bacterium]|nr:MAG: AraC family transcriptional regulator [Moraxellaceae bacterium]
MLQLELRTVSTVYVRALLRLVESYGINTSLLLHELGIETHALDNATGRLNARLVHQLWDKTVILTEDNGLGLKLAQSFKLGSFRTLGIAAMSCATLLESMQLLLRYHRLVSDVGAFTATINPYGDIVITYAEQFKSFSLLPQQIEAIMGSILVQARLLTDQTIMPTMVSFKHVALVDHAIYQDFFGIMPQFDAQEYVLGFRRADMQQPLPHADQELCQIHCQLAEQQLDQLAVAHSVTAFAMQWLANSIQFARLTRIDDLAQAMQMSTRTLQRLLAQEGKSWTQLVDEARCNAAKQLLQQNLALDEIACRLGYHDASSFSRAAKRWFGVTAGQWRNRFIPS